MKKNVISQKLNKDLSCMKCMTLYVWTFEYLKLQICTYEQITHHLVFLFRKGVNTFGGSSELPSPDAGLEF